MVFFIKRPNLSLWFIAIYGMLFGVGVWGMLGLSMHLGISAGIASLILQLSAFLTVFLSYLFFGDKMSKWQISGLLFALIGLVLIASISDGSVSLIGVTLASIAAICLSISILMLKKVNIDDVLGLLVWSSLFSPLPLLLMAFFVYGGEVMLGYANKINGLVVFSILFQAYPTTLIGRWLFNQLIVKYPISLTLPISFLVPIFGFLGSNIIFDEQIGPVKILSCSLIILGLICSTFGANIWQGYHKFKA